jgi:3'-phosphoadenosine 5'-phosphosulfate sulfotransferase (PAPS reductase)/FAD synthetase
VSRLFGVESPEDWIERAHSEHKPIKTACLFSGGSDSLVVAHRCRDHYDELVHIDTGTALPGVLDHVRECARDLDKPLCVLTHLSDVYREVVLGGRNKNGKEWKPLGFPGPAQHNLIYNRLKERLIAQYLRETKEGHPRQSRVLFLSGIRRRESARRSSRPAINRNGSAVYVSPLIEWTNQQMRDYREQHDLRLSDVAALTHRSGECNCGAFADEDERKMIQSLFPEWWRERIEPIEREAEKRGLPHCRWGGSAGDIPTEAGPMCSSCEVKIADQQMKLTATGQLSQGEGK